MYVNVEFDEYAQTETSVEGICPLLLISAWSYNRDRRMRRLYLLRYD